MNRLWVRFSLVMIGVVILLLLIPVGYQVIGTAFDLIENDVGIEFREEMGRQFTDEQIAAFQDETRRNFLSTMMVLLITGSVLVLAASLWLSRTLTAPLDGLAAGVKEIEAQNFTHRVPVEGSEEIATVAAAFNSMAAQLENAETLRRNLLADVAHELRNPLHVLQGNLQAILDGVYPLSEEEIGRLLTQTNHLTTLVQDLHELAQAEARQLTLHKQELHVGELVKACVTDFQTVAQDKHVHLQAELLGKLPLLMVDSSRLRQVINNLLDNALRYTPEEGRVIVTVQQIDHDLRITMADTGEGIAAEDVPHVFDRFYRADKARTRDRAGTGLGLAIVQAIVEAHDGQVSAFSEGVGRGSTFTICLPIMTSAA